MADTLKEFSSFTGKSYSDLKDGITIASTNGSQKAVIKHITIDNPNGRNIQIREGSATGPLVAQTTADGLSGNEILDNSQSLVATTDYKPGVTAIHQVGWYEGHENNLGNTTGYIRTWGPKGYKDRNHSWDRNALDWGPTSHYDPTSNNDSGYGRRWFNSAATGQSLQAVSDSWFGKDGRFYWVHRQGNGSLGGSSLSDFTVRRFETDSTTVTAYGSGQARVSVYDGYRYFYTIADGASVMRKYDTQTLGTSDTYTEITLRPADKDTGTQSISFYNETAGYYYCDGYILVNGSNTSADDSAGSIRLISTVTGKTKSVFGPHWENFNTYGAGTAYNTQRPSIGLCRDSQGDYWTFVGRYGSNTTGGSDENKIWISCIGNNPEKTFLANGQNWGRTRRWMVKSNQTAAKYLEIPEAATAQTLGLKLGVHGAYFGNPAGCMMHSPGLSRYLILVSHRYRDGTGIPSSERGPWFNVIDFDNWDSREGFICDNYQGQFMQETVTGSAEKYTSGVYRMIADPTGVDGSFGDISIRTSGILVT